MARRKITPEEVVEAISKSMSDYAKVTLEQVQEICEYVGDEAKAIAQSDSPRRTGKYKRGWSKKTEFSRHGVKVTVHNKRYRLTHLLEYGHKTGRKRRGKAMTDAHAHIAYANDYAQQELERRIRKALGG